MKHQHQHGADVNVNVDIPVDDITEVLDKVTECAITIIVVATAAHICKKWLT